MPAELVSKTSANISDNKAAGISLATMAVVTGLYDLTGHRITPAWETNGAKDGEGKAIAIIGGSSSVGQYVVQFGRLSGFDRIITNASSSHHEFLKKPGAHVVFDRKSSSANDCVAASNNRPVHYVYDAVSTKETQALGVQIAHASKGAANRVGTVQGADADAVKLEESMEPKVEVKQIFGLGGSPMLRQLREPMAKHLGSEDGYIAKGLFVPNRVGLIEGGLRAMEEALRTNKEGVSGEKVVFRRNN
ncbi:hypothetical protein BDV29DRAFT_185144 [Aspergillus leporis]|uniref:Alcohol dehydrogenase-like C-terminal domain-containing protein n=1 Tax=Aspergillus leporis TaxID=41062 RepID=A0A5N5WHY9_9EURO|nr:hypothetical protein BDV29DRAFT_185144 [Aspergillus leporis]